MDPNNIMLSWFGLMLLLVCYAWTGRIANKKEKFKEQKNNTNFTNDIDILKRMLADALLENAKLKGKCSLLDEQSHKLF